MPLASRFTAVIRLYRQKSIFNKLSLHTQRRTCTFKIFSRSCTSNGRTMDTNTLKDIALPNRLQPKLPLLPALPLCRPYGVNPLPAGGQGRRQRRQERHQPHSLPSFATPSSTQKHTRPTQSNARQKTTTLRRSGSFGCGQQGTQRKGSAATAVYIFSGMPLPRCLTCPSALPPVPKALRPPQHLSKRMAGSRGALPLMRDSVRPLCV